MNYLDILGLVADTIGIFGAGFAFYAAIQARQIRKAQELEQQRQNKKVTVLLKYGDALHRLPVELRRADLTRAEILGRIGMIPMKQKGERFSLSHLNTPEFLKHINQIVEGTGDADLIIPCTREEFEQFDLQSDANA
jgi:hypothetical protein